jgi:hypothetical protein
VTAKHPGSIEYPTELRAHQHYPHANVLFCRGLIFQKKFFWFGTDAVETKALSSYLRGEKDTSSANHNAAWASHTGKGLLFFSKKATDKATPAGLFNLVRLSYT